MVAVMVLSLVMGSWPEDGRACDGRAAGSASTGLD